MQLDDHLVIHTPEGVELRLTLAGLASRIVAALLDTLIQLVAVLVLIIAITQIADEELALLGLGLIAAVFFGIFFGYPIIFEVLDGGRSLGKRAAGIRVVRLDGGPIGFGAAATRNVLRLVDILPGVYGVGALSILLTPNHQRLGDLAAGTVVIRERAQKPLGFEQRVMAPAGLPWDVSAVTLDEVSLIRRFFERRDGLGPDHRRALARQITTKLSAKVAGTGDVADPEEFLARVLAEKTSRQ